MTKTEIDTSAGDAITLEDLGGEIEMGLVDSDAEAQYTSLTDAEALELAHALIGMVMKRQRQA